MECIIPKLCRRYVSRTPCALVEARNRKYGWVVLLGLLGCWVVPSGCASYRIGATSLYAPDVTTVYVPMIESDSFRRDLGEQLTEAVVKEIELKTPFKVVGTPSADSILSARLVGDTKRVIVENRNDDPRVIEHGLAAEVTWLNRRREPLCTPNLVPLPPELLPIGQASSLIAAAGQSTVSSQQQAIIELAEQIVATMEEPW